MTPSSDPASTATEEAIFPADLLDDGEVVLLAVKPSGWFVLLISLPVLVGAVLVATGVYVADEVLHMAGPQPTVLLICLAVGCLRLVIACFQWLGCLYVLTSKRIMCIRGVVRTDVLAFPLKKIAQVFVTAGSLERTLQLGSLEFEISGNLDSQSRWSCLANPTEVYQAVLDAIHRTR